MDVNVAFKKRLGKWIYQFDIIIVNDEGIASVAGSAIVGNQDTDFEVVIMVPQCIKDKLECIRAECRCLQRELATYLEN